MIALWLAAAHAQSSVSPPVAPAAELRWSWEGPRTYHAEALLQFFHAYPAFDEALKVAALSELQVVFDLSCKSRSSDRVTLVECGLDHVVLEGTAVKGDEDKALAVVAELQARLAMATVQLQTGSDGHVVDVDLEGLPQDSAHASDVNDELRQIVMRAITPLDVMAPKSVVPGKPWRQKGSPLCFRLMTAGGTAGGVALEHVLDDGTVVSSKGHASVSTSEMTVGDQSGGSMSQIVAVTMNAHARWDPAAHGFVYREVIVQGALSATSLSNSVPAYFTQIGWVAVPLGDGTYESLDPAAPIGSVVAPVSSAATIAPPPSVPPSVPTSVPPVEQQGDPVAQ